MDTSCFSAHNRTKMMTTTAAVAQVIAKSAASVKNCKLPLNSLSEATEQYYI